MKRLSVALLTAGLLVFSQLAATEPPPVQTPSSAEDLRAALGGGVPMGRWKEGLLFEGCCEIMQS